MVNCMIYTRRVYVKHSNGRPRADVAKSGSVEDPGAFASSFIERANALDPNLAPSRMRLGGNVQAVNLVTSRLDVDFTLIPPNQWLNLTY